MLNILEAFFRRPWLHLLPLILMLILGAVTAFSTGNEFRSVGTISAASSTVIDEITQQTPGVTFETPATITARNINEQLRTANFLTLVAQNAELQSTDATAPIVLQTIAESVAAAADGDSLVRVTATNADPELAFRLADATLAAYRETVLNNRITQSESAVTFLQTQSDAALEEVNLARDELDAYLTANPVQSAEDRSPQQQVEVDRLTAEVERAEGRYSLARDKVDAANEEMAQATVEIEQRYKVLDPPEVPLAAEPRLKKAVLTLILFGVLGIGLSLASVVVSATLDRTIRLPNDVTGKFGLDVLAVVPDARAR